MFMLKQKKIRPKKLPVFLLTLTILIFSTLFDVNVYVDKEATNQTKKKSVSPNILEKK
jgi:hypothetical protein